MTKEKIINYINDWRANPLHWTNNKRRNHGLPSLRGKLNNKKRFNPSKHILFNLFEEYMTSNLPAYQKKIIMSMTNVKEIPYE